MTLARALDARTVVPIEELNASAARLREAFAEIDRLRAAHAPKEEAWTTATTSDWSANIAGLEAMGLFRRHAEDLPPRSHVYPASAVDHAFAGLPDSARGFAGRPPHLQPSNLPTTAAGAAGPVPPSAVITPTLASQILAALESDATQEQRFDAFNDLRDLVFPLESKVAAEYTNKAGSEASVLPRLDPSFDSTLAVPPPAPQETGAPTMQDRCPKGQTGPFLESHDRLDVQPCYLPVYLASQVEAREAALLARHQEGVQFITEGAQEKLAELRAEVARLTRELDAMRARAIVAEHHKALSLLGKSSWQEKVEQDLCVALAEAQVRIDTLTAQRAAPPAVAPPTPTYMHPSDALRGLAAELRAKCEQAPETTCRARNGQRGWQCDYCVFADRLDGLARRSEPR